MSDNEDLYLKQITSPSNLKRILSFEVPRQRVESEIEEILKNIRKEVELPGFRKGKAPLSLVRSRFAETAKKEALERLIPEIYGRALKKHDFHPVLPGEVSEIEFEGDGPLKFQVEVELYPQVVIGEYKGIKVKKQIRPVADSDVDSEIQALRERLAMFERVDRQACEGDVVIVDYWRIDQSGNPVPDSKVNNFPVELASQDLVKDFKQALLGVTKGETKVVDVTYPQDFPRPELRGKQARFQVEVKEVGRMILPEVDDDFARRVGAETLLDLRLQIRQMLEKARNDEAEERAKRELLSTVASQSDFEVPDGIVKLMLERMVESYVGREGLDRQDDEEKIRQVKERLEPLARNMVKEEFVVVEIAKREGIKVEDSEIESLARSIAERVGRSTEEVMKIAKQRNEIGRWRQDMMRDKVLAFLYENALIEE